MGKDPRREVERTAGMVAQGSVQAGVSRERMGTAMRNAIRSGSSWMKCFFLALVILSPGIRAQSAPEPPPGNPCAIITIGDGSGSRKGVDYPPTCAANVAIEQGGLPLPTLVNNSEYAESVHAFGTRVGSTFLLGYSGMEREGEFD